jgi:homogentisate 1,2-dioxygenase
MAEYRERVTTNGRNIDYMRFSSPVECQVADSDKELVRKVNLFDPKYQPSNYTLADGAPLPIATSEEVRIDLSKRTKEPMSFWHRNNDADEVIICMEGALIWETEMGTVRLERGEMLLIPRGVAHRALPGSDGQTNVAVELKINGHLEWTSNA